MTLNISVANRKGGVGKSTVATMLAHGFSCWGQKNTLLVDLDTQCNSSLMLVGGERWREARYDERTIADYFYDRSLRAGADAADYLITDAGDVVRPDGSHPGLSLFCGSLDVEDILDEQLLNMAKGMKRLDMGVIRTRVHLASSYSSLACISVIPGEHRAKRAAGPRSAAPGCGCGVGGHNG